MQGVETGNIAVPSLSNRSGDLSDQAQQITGKVSGDYLARFAEPKGWDAPFRRREPYYTAGCTDSNGNCVFPNAVIPAAAWSSPSKALLGYIPKPNVGTNSFSDSGQNETLGDNKAALRLDWTTHLATCRPTTLRDGYDLGQSLPDRARRRQRARDSTPFSRGRAQLVNLGWTRPWSATMVNELHFQLSAQCNKIGQPIGGVGPTLASQGFVEGAGTLGIVPSILPPKAWENVSFNDFTIAST